MPKKKKGTWGGKRPGTGGKREGAGRKPIRGIKRDSAAFYLDISLTYEVKFWSELTGHTKGEIVEAALRDYFGRLRREGFAE